MAKNITLMGASYSDVPAVTLPQTGGGTARFDDASVTTATASDVASGKIFLASDGTITTGTASSGGGAFTVTATFSNGEWSTLDKTFAQIQSAYSQGLTIEVVAYNSSGGEYCQTSCTYYAESEPPQFEYRIVWFDYDDTGLLYQDTYDYTSNGVELYERLNYGTPTTLVEKTITVNGTYNPILTDYADGYSLVTVNVPSSGSSAWTKVAETSYQVSTTSTSAATVATWATGHSELWTKDKWVYVRIRDTAGLRDGYFFGSDQFFYNSSLANGSSPTYISTALRIYTRYSNPTITPTAATGSTGYGVWADYLYPDGRIRIRKRYNSTNSLTVNGTFKVEVYLLDPAGGVPIFE